MTRWTPNEKVLGGMSVDERGQWIALADYQAVLNDPDYQQCCEIRGQQEAELQSWRDVAKEIGEVDPHGLALGINELRREAAWAMQQLVYHLPARLDTETSKKYDRCTEFLSRVQSLKGAP